MGRWSHLDSDAERLPEGMQRIAYDADSSVYTYRDAADGSLWEGEPGNRYGKLHRVEGAPPLPSWSSPPSPASPSSPAQSFPASPSSIHSRPSFHDALSSYTTSPSGAPHRGSSDSTSPVLGRAPASGGVRRSQTTRESRRRGAGQPRDMADVEAFLSGAPPPNPMAMPRRSNTVSRIVGLIRRRSVGVGSARLATGASRSDSTYASNPSPRSPGPDSSTPRGAGTEAGLGERASSRQGRTPRAFPSYSPVSLSRQTSVASSRTAWSRSERGDGGLALGRQATRLSRASTVYGEQDNDRDGAGGSADGTGGRVGGRPRRATTFDEILAQI